MWTKKYDPLTVPRYLIFSHKEYHDLFSNFSTITTTTTTKYTKKSKKKLFPFKKHFKKAAFIHFCRISRFFFKWKIIQINFVQNAIVGCIKVFLKNLTPKQIVFHSLIKKLFPPPFNKFRMQGYRNKGSNSFRHFFIIMGSYRRTVTYLRKLFAWLASETCSKPLNIV